MALCPGTGMHFSDCGCVKCEPMRKIAEGRFDDRKVEVSVSPFRIVSTTHGISCAGCQTAVEKAEGMARVTGSVGAAYHDAGNHVAKVERKS